MAFHYFYENIFFKKEKYTAKRPTVPVSINGYNFTGLLDSGSDAIVIPTEIAEVLQLKPIDKTELSQLDGSSKECSIANINLEFGKGHEQYKFKSKVLIADTPRVILGRKGFFEHFKITFDELSGFVIFRSNSSEAKSSSRKSR